MPIALNFKLPLSTPEYDQQQDQLMRRSVEQHLDDIRAEISTTRDATSSDTALSKRRHQFLLMGA